MVYSAASALGEWVQSVDDPFEHDCVIAEVLDEAS